MEFRVLGQPLLIEHLVLLLKGFHASLEMHLQPLATMNREKLHSLRHPTTFIYSADDVCKGVLAASTKVCLPTGCTIMVGSVAGAEPKLSDTIVDGCLLKGIRCPMSQGQVNDN